MSGLTPIRALALRKPLAPWEFATGHVCEVRDIDGAMEELRVEATNEKSEEKFNELYRTIVPDATEADWKSMTTEDYANLWSHAAQKLIATLKLVEDSRKNDDAGKAAPKTRRSRPSKPIIPPVIPPPESRGPSGETGLTSG